MNGLFVDNLLTPPLPDANLGHVIISLCYSVQSQEHHLEFLPLKFPHLFLTLRLGRTVELYTQFSHHKMCPLQ